MELSVGRTQSIQSRTVFVAIVDGAADKVDVALLLLFVLEARAPVGCMSVIISANNAKIFLPRALKPSYRRQVLDDVDPLVPRPVVRDQLLVVEDHVRGDDGVGLKEESVPKIFGSPPKNTSALTVFFSGQCAAQSSR